MDELEDARPVEEVEGTATEAPTAETPPATPELKVVLHLKGDRSLVGVQGDGTDPVVEVLEAASLEEALAAVPGTVARARERWATSPRNPRYEGPPPAPAATPSQPARQSRTAAAPVDRPRMF